jgi:hypothetical protein
MKYESNAMLSFTQELSSTLFSPKSDVNNIEWTEYVSPTNFRRLDKCPLSDTLSSVSTGTLSPSTRVQETRTDSQTASSIKLEQTAKSATGNGLSTTPSVSTDEPAQIEPVQPAEEHIELSAEQRSVLSMVKNKENVFFTGPAGIIVLVTSFHRRLKHIRLGTGKSVLLREIIKSLPRSGGKVAVTAPTGIAGLNIGGRTIHSFAGIGLGTEPANQLVKKILGSKLLKKRWNETSVLIIDESESLAFCRTATGIGLSMKSQYLC